jgi:superfamily I DNA/RNA helicase
MYTLCWTKRFKDCIEDFRARNERALLDLNIALGELADRPFGNPKLQTHEMHRAQGRTFITYVGSRGHRLIWRLVNRTAVLLLFGEHDAVERAAERIRLDLDLDEGRARVFDEDPATNEPVAYEVRRQSEGVLFMAWNDEDLAGFGFEPQEISVLRTLDTETALLELEQRMRPAAFPTAFNLIAWGHPDGEDAAERELAQLQVAAEEPAPEFVLQFEDEAAADRQLEEAILRPSSRQEFAPLAADAIAAILDKPIEDWMVFLHPDQVRLTERPFTGPARVRGGAGTGKTVVALHRARHLADTYDDGRVLFTTYVANLPPVFEELYRRLSPSTVDRVEFINLHKWAWRFLARSGERPNTDPQAIERCYGQAWQRVASAGSVLARGYGRGYYKEEIDWVIKGRGLTTLEAYLKLARTGRGTPLPEAHRRAVWDLLTEYEQHLRQQRVHDFNDVLRRALELARDGALPEPYAAVVVDEAQDFTELGVRLVHAISGGDKRDGLFIVGDGQQSVYPGGYSLSSVGVDVKGRSSILRVNYRNTRQILDAARRVVGDRPFDDLDEDLEPGRRDVTVLRQGRPPTFVAFADQAEHDTALVAAIDDAARLPGVGPGDLAVLLPTNRLVEEYSRRIAELGYRTCKLQKYDGKPRDEVKVGTYQRGKGLEFKWVFLPRLEPRTLGESKRFNEDDEAYTERLDLLRRQLFVAMTRARDQLWSGWVGRPSGLLGLPA